LSKIELTEGLEELRGLKQWVVWRTEDRNGKRTKVPRRSSNCARMASSTDPATWSTFDGAARTAASPGNKLGGVGFVLTRDDPYVFIDLDGCVEDEILSDEAIRIVEMLGGYSEVSVSGTGVHIVVKGEWGERENKKTLATTAIKAIEVYDHSRYMTVSGDVYSNGAGITDGQAGLDKLAGTYGYSLAQSSTVDASVSEENGEGVDLSAFEGLDLGTVGDYKPTAADVMRSIKESRNSDAFAALFKGTWESEIPELNGDHSRADSKLLSILWWHSGGHRDVAEEIFSASACGQRDKWTSRKDYRDRTWRMVSDGEPKTWTGPSEEPEDVGSAGTVNTPRRPPEPPWRRVKDEQIRDIVDGSVLAPIVEAMEAVTKPGLPIQATLPKALVLSGCALSGPDLGIQAVDAIYGSGELDRDKLDSYDWSQGCGNRIARVRIMTAGGQVPSMWAMTVGRSASGKDIGDVVGVLSNSLGWWIGQTGTAEGLMDAYTRKPNGILAVGELMNWFDPHHYESRAKSWITDAFSRGYFKVNMSQRGNSKERKAPFCFPNLLANIQGETLETKACILDLRSGFLSRFLYTIIPVTAWCPSDEDMTEKLGRAKTALERLSTVRGVFNVPQGYQEQLAAMFRAHPVPDDLMLHADRLMNEYLPRLALILSVPPEPPATAAETEVWSVYDGPSEIDRITDEAWAKAETLVLWFFGQAEKVLGNIQEDEQAAKWERNLRRIYRYIKNNGPVTKTDISRNCSVKGTNSKYRETILKELREPSLPM